MTGTRFSLGVNTCFAVKRWPDPAEWARLVREDLGLSLVQHSLDLVLLDAPPDVWRRQASEVRRACVDHGIELHSTFTGLAAYSFNGLLSSEPDARAYWLDWHRRAIEFTAIAGGRASGGHVGAFSVRDWRDPARRHEAGALLVDALGRLAGDARRAGLEELYVENLAAAREPSTMAGIEPLLADGDADRVPIRLCLDVGHQCVAGASGDDLDPYAWLRRFGARAGMVQLQQSDAHADHHWPFTEQANRAGRIHADAVFDALDGGGATGVPLVLEVIPPFEADDDGVIRDMSESAGYWREALARRSS